MSYYNLPNVTQALFRDHLSRLFALPSNIPCLFLDHNRSSYNFKPHLVFSFCARVVWLDVCIEFTNLIKVVVDVDVSRCHYQIFNLRNIREIHLFNRYVFILLTKMRTKTRTFLSTWYIFNVQKCTHTDFPLVSYIVIGFHEKPENFYREKPSVALVTGHLLTFLVVLSLVGLVTTQILICENQIIWRLEILLGTIVAALLKIKCNGRFV